MKSILAQKTIKGTLWMYLSRYSGRILNFLTIAILARLLEQDDFGVASYALVAVGFLEVTGLGIGPALIYFDKNPERTNTGFWLALLFGVVLFGLWWLAAPLVGMFFQDMRAVPVTRALGFSFPLLGLMAVPQSFLRKELAFHKNFVPNFVGAIVKGITGITLAWLGFAAWSIIIAQLFGTSVKMIAFWLVMSEKLWPSFHIDLSFVKPLLGYASNIIAIEVLGVLLINIDYLIVGRYLGASALAVYTIAFRLPELLIMNFAAIAAMVLFPVYSKMKDPAAIGRGYLMALRYVTMVILPMAVGLALVARPLVLLAFSEKWAEAIPIVTAIAIYSAIRSIASDGGTFKALGKPNVTTKLHVITLLCVVPVLWWVTVQFNSLVIIAWTQVLMVTFIGMLRLVVTSRVLKVPLADIFRMLQPGLLGSGIMFVVVWLVLRSIPADMWIVQILTAVSIGVVVYGIVMWWLQRDVMQQASVTLRTALWRRTS